MVVLLVPWSVGDAVLPCPAVPPGAALVACVSGPPLACPSFPLGAASSAIKKASHSVLPGGVMRAGMLISYSKNTLSSLLYACKGLELSSPKP